MRQLSHTIGPAASTRPRRPPSEEEARMGRQNPTARLSLEDLETRLTPTASMTVGKSLWVAGTNGDDTAVVRNSATPGYIEVVDNGKTTSFKASALTGGYLYFYGYKGDDRLTNQT